MGVHVGMRMTLGMVVAWLAAAAAVQAAPAHADEAGFIQILDRSPSVYNRPTVIRTGYEVCQILRGGTISTARVTVPQAVLHAGSVVQAAMNPAQQRQGSNTLVVAAANELCPDQMPITRAYFDK